MCKFDLVVKNAKVIDGTGNPWFYGCVGVKDGKIAYIGNLNDDIDCCEIIDAKHQILSPGFIDCHTHSDFALLRDPGMLSKLKQGVTTQLIGPCGISAAPISPDRVNLLDAYAGFAKAGVEPEYNWETFGDFLNVIDKLPLGTNIGAYVGHGTVKINVMGFESRKPTEEELKEMKKQVREAMEDGAFGMSSGLIYPPGVYSEPEEIEEMAKELNRFNGVYLSHMRNESYNLLKAVKEIIHVAEVANIPVQVHHHKAMGIKNWGLVKESVKLIEEARKKGLDITIDQYPYTASSTTLRACLPPWVHEGGIEKIIERLNDPSTRARIIADIEYTDNWENFYKNSNGAKGVVISYTPYTPEFECKTLYEAGKMVEKEPLDVLCDIIAANKGNDNACYHMLSEDDINYVMKSPYTMIGSDSIPVAPGAKCHPRTNGTFPRVLGKYAREGGVITLEDAVKKITGYPAGRFNIMGKGLIKVGYDADLVIFNPDTVIDGATYEDPFKEPIGINFVLVNGQLAIKEGKSTGNTSGRVVRRK
ncbi:MULTISPECIES: N-acyl-D-amino-acid deacylase family protein [unclassified Sedimentibacter]|uniref:N-acyl-D-amino-acid deacylase family protein n=1 Tax=unclassified Sedimentibacter TaxID=2649220 RepID=UPI0027E1E535|nr:D-aminoacylase [Sedimentibacter sp. MB35-C1]WMJ78446.1 D-aminoacylase [Sedimentibacter sp. MB35-C1]